MKYILGIDQSTQGTKAVLFDEKGLIVCRKDKSHQQIISQEGWVSHDPMEIYDNVICTVKSIMIESKIDTSHIVGVGICNQRESVVGWDESGKNAGNSVVWQCKRGKKIAENLTKHSTEVVEKTGILLSPYFSAAKMSWLLKNKKNISHLGTMDSWLIYKLTNNKSFLTDYSNAARTQLFNIHKGKWDEELCELFEVPIEMLPEVRDSNSCFGYTDFEGILDCKVPICGVMGDSNSALFGQNCLEEGMVKVTYGTGSSVMMNIGDKPLKSTKGLSVSIGWKRKNEISYVLEGNINYAGGVVRWLQEKMKIISSPEELEENIYKADEADETIFVPAFTGLSAPYWDTEVKAVISGMSRNTGKEEIIKAAVESIAFQVDDVVEAMKEDSLVRIKEIRVDGGLTKSSYLMKFQADLGKVRIKAAKSEELSVIGVAYMAGISLGIYKEKEIFKNFNYQTYEPDLFLEKIKNKKNNWTQTISMLLRREGEKTIEKTKNFR